MPPHDCAAGVRAINRHKKRTLLHPFGFCRERTDPREVAQTANLFATSSVQTITPQKQFFCGDPEKKCRGTKCRRTDVRQGYEPKTGTKKRTFSHPFGSFGGRTDPREVALCVNLFTTTQRVQFGRSVEAQSAAAQTCGRGMSQNRHKKRTFSRSFWRLLRDSDPRHFG